MEKLSAKASKIYNLIEVRHCEQDNNGIYCTYSRKERLRGLGRSRARMTLCNGYGLWVIGY